MFTPLQAAILNGMSFLKMILVFLIGAAVGYYFGTDHGWEDAVRTLGL